MDNSISVITSQFSVVVKSMEKGLRDQGYTVTLIKDEIEDVKNAMDKTDVFVLYLTNVMIEDMDHLKRLFLICDTLKDNDRNPVLIGADNNQNEFIKTVPALKDFPWFNRPLDMFRLMIEIQKEVKRYLDSKSRKRILIIDDDNFYARMVAEWLSGSYHAEVVSDAMEAISFIAKTKVDLILLDYEMPVVDGPKVLEMLRSHSDTSSIPVMFLTGIGTKESIARVMAFKPQGYILKSTTREELLLTLSNFFNKK